MTNPPTPLHALAQAVGAVLTPKAHARLSPSSAKRWMACPGSLSLLGAHPDTPTSYSDKGTAIHEVSARCLTTRANAVDYLNTWVLVSDPRDREERKVKFDEDMVDIAQGYVDHIRAKSRGYDLFVEQRLEFSKFIGEPPARAPGTLPPGTITVEVEVEDPAGSGRWVKRLVGIDDPGADGQFGTTDAGFVDWDAGEIDMDDLKTGHTPVVVEGNPQLLVYTLALLGKLYEDYLDARRRGEVQDVQGYKTLKAFRHPEGVHAKKGADDDEAFW